MPREVLRVNWREAVEVRPALVYPYLFSCFAGGASNAQELVCLIMHADYAVSPIGLPGNDDRLRMARFLRAWIPS